MLSEKELRIVNEIIESIYSTENLKELRLQFLKKTSALIDFSFSDFNMGVLNLHHCPTLVDPVVWSKYDQGFEKRFIYMYESKYCWMDYLNWAFISPESLVYRESDMISEKVRCQSRFFQEYLKPFGLIYVSGIIIANANQFLGAISFYKTENAGDFTDRDLAIMSLFVPHLQRRLEAEELGSRKKLTGGALLLKYEYQLTDREMEIAGYLLYGYSNGEISNTLRISINTVKKHVSNMFCKLGINGRPQFIRFVILRDLISLWDTERYGLAAQSNSESKINA